MNVLLFANRAVAPVRAMTGIGRYVEGLARELADDDGGWTYDMAAAYERGDPTWLPPDIRFRRLPRPRRVLHTAWTVAGVPRIEQLVGAFDLLHALHPSYPIPTRRPAVITVHDLMPIQHPEWYDRDEVWGFRHVLRHIAERNWEVIVDSEYVASQVRALRTISGDRISVVYLAVDDRFSMPSDRGRVEVVCRHIGVAPGQYILAVGNVSTRKNLVTLVRGLAQTAPSGPRLVLAGRPHTDDAAVRVEIDRLGLTDRVRITGFVASDDLPALVQGALALAHPSVDEGFGIPPLEAMAAGTPVIAAAAGSIPEIVADAALLVDPQDAQGWTAAIERVVSDEELRGRLIRDGRARAGCFTWARVASQTRDVYQRALGERPTVQVHTRANPSPTAGLPPADPRSHT